MASKKEKKSANTSVSEESADKNQEGKRELCPGFKDVDSFVKHGLCAVLSATKASAGLPQAGDEFDFYRSFPLFREFCDSQGDKLLQCMSQIMLHHNCRSHVRDSNKLTGLEERFDLVVDSNDVILEKVGILLDEADGVNRSQQPVMPAGFQPPKIVVSSWNRKGSSSDGRAGTFKLLHAKNIQRPQLKFKEKIDNSNTPFIPKIFVKPNAMKPLPSYFTSKNTCRDKPGDGDVPAALADFIHQQRTQEHVEDMFAHPYQYELDHLTTPENLLCKPEPQMYRSISETSCSFIDTLEDLVALNEKLCKLPEFAVDLEHHSYRSFLGITCLMQISTREEDFIIDTLVLRSEMYILNESFTDSNIVKVFHGADSDIEWLQKDLGLYVVNLFDTHQASRALNLARHSLDHLMKHYCSMDTDKRYQLADWRIRPLPEEMVQYARSDTHYLLYIYDCMRAQLLDFNHGQPGLLQSVWNKSRDISLKKYIKPIFTEESYLELLRKQKKTFNTQQLAAFRLLFAWRDKLARQEDESTGYVLPTHMMSKISEELPKEPQGIIACCNPVPPLVRQQVNELHLLVQEAREIPLLKAEIAAQKKKGLTPIRRPETLLFGPHDTSKVSEDNLSFSVDEMPVKQGTLFSEDEQKMDVEVQIPSGLVASAKITLFEEPERQVDGDSLSVTQTKARQINESFENPFRMYLPTRDVHISKNAKFDPSSKIFEISKRWKLQTLEQQQQELEAKQKAKKEAKLQAKKAAGERKKTTETYQQSLQNVASVRQQALEFAKDNEKKRERIPSEVGESTPKAKKKLKKSSEEPEAASQEEFKPFDYSQSDLKVFSGGKSNDNRHFDPNRRSHGFKKKKVAKGQKLNQVAGNRSMSYLPEKSASKTYGNVLVLDGVIQCTERDEFAYQEMIANLPLCSHPCPKKVLIIGGGDGGVLREVVKHPLVESVVLCEIDEDVINVSKKFLPAMAKGFFDPKLSLHVGDGFEFMKKNQDAFDIIITDSSDPVGPAESLFKETYYQLMKTALKKDGILCSQGECQWLHLELIKEMQTFCKTLFPVVDYAYTTIPTYPSGQIGFMLCSKNHETHFQKPVKELSDEERESMQLKYYNTDIHKASFVLPEFARKVLNEA
ncbi:spermidine synthase isoform X2 [Synchiropus splendidus]|uniref:spermidine synthase isoform X2 n=1 Tax=Synchiropus splendidus TaxID=270530 RepID=UPI00237D3E62|nr:spermidine synthase isoform X2 [Synchiropus splendidus]